MSAEVAADRPGSYYGRPIVKPAPWAMDIPLYLFTGGLAAGSSLLAAGADLTGRRALRRAGRLGALGALGASVAALVHDLGRPRRFFNMLRSFKPTSPMSVGTWILGAYGSAAATAAAAELVDVLGRRPGPLRALTAIGRPAGLLAAVAAPGVASYTAVLLADTATPAWHEAGSHLPFVFVGSAAAAAGGFGILAAPSEAGPARRMAMGGALLDLLATRRMEAAMGIAAEPRHEGRAGALARAATVLTAGGAVASAFAHRARWCSVLAGSSLVLGSLCTRLAVFESGLQSARDPRYTVEPQRARLS
jgi:Ni/Fe-hydrogenase subunit HybB-like protein